LAGKKDERRKVSGKYSDVRWTLFSAGYHSVRRMIRDIRGKEGVGERYSFDFCVVVDGQWQRGRLSRGIQMESIASTRILEGKGKDLRIPSCLEGFVGSWRGLRGLEVTVRTRHKRQVTIWVSSRSERLLWK
jgi:hypothetical protein